MSHDCKLDLSASRNGRKIGATSRTPRIQLSLLAVCLGLAALALNASATAPKGYQQTNLISNGCVDAAVVDQNFVDPWGISIGTDFWINTNVSGLNYITDASGAISFTVSIPPAKGTGLGSPTGTIFTGAVPSGSFLLPDKSGPFFLFSTLDGTVSGWSGGAVQVALNNSKLHAVYNDMALLTNTKGTFIVLANFGKVPGVEVYDKNYKRAMTGGFHDPNVPATYAPYSVHVLGDKVYVTYTPRDATFSEILGPGHGFVDAFDLNGKFLTRAIPAGGKLNAPWGMAIAPATWGQFANDVLVGNFGDGTIAAFDPNTWAFKGRVTDVKGNPIANPGLWEIVFGQANPAVGDPNTLYFTAGLKDETAGLFGTITMASGTVTKTKTTVTSDGNPDTTSSKVTFTALVAPTKGTGEPEGHVAFTLDGKPLANVWVDSTAHATASANKLTVGKHKVMATYSGDGSFATSAGAFIETIQAPKTAAPVFSPAVGTYSTTQTVTITDATTGAKIYYTTNGSTPTTSSTLYTKPIAVAATTTLKAMAAASGLPPSPMVSGTYTISSTTTNPTATPTFTPGAGTYYSAQSVSIKDTTPGATIYYTTDGSTPTTKSPVYTKAIAVSSTMTIRAIAQASGWGPSAVAGGTFTISSWGY